METGTIVTHSDEQTVELGHRIASLLRPAMVLALTGDLGTGKTVLTRGIARGLGIAEPVTSPTFTIVQEYHLPPLQDEGCEEEHAPECWLFHLDMYRIECAEDALAFGIEEYLFVPDGITVIEWPERIQCLLENGPEVAGADFGPDARVAPPPALFAIHLEHVAEGQRRIVLPERLRPAAQVSPKLG